ncbi:HNH endonuclease [Nocardia salmonicida]|uniref:HNH endonuclease n=1 Tax=Nocardia salmonicida TaxID=53431 RepID=UPI0033FF57EE
MAVTKRVRYEVLRRDNHTCRYCGAKAGDAPLTVDHVVPVALGGGDDPANLVAACRDCNAGKTSVAPDQPIVEQVSEDALRWAQAMQVAAAERAAVYERNQQSAAEFRSIWDNWRTDNGNGGPLPLPAGWSNSIKNLIAAGLAMSDFEELVEVAVQSRANDPFRYFCGCCWTRVRQAQTRAAEILAEKERASASLIERVEEAFEQADEEREDVEAAEQYAWDDWYTSTFGTSDNFNQEKFDQFLAIHRADMEAEETGGEPDLSAYPEALTDEIRQEWRRLAALLEAARVGHHTT